MKKIKINSKESLVLSFLYKTFVGRVILLLVARVSFSKVVTKFLDCKCSKIFINGFIKKYNINNELFVDREYKSFNDYFSRDKKEKYKNVDIVSNKFISPCDCKLTVYNAIDNFFCIKNVSYDLETLLMNKQLANEYKDGYVVICRLTPDNFHRYCYIDDGYHGENIKIKGVLHTVRPVAIENIPVFITNSRSYTILNTVNFGKVIQVEVGALLVGKIKNNYVNYNFKKGEEKGLFEYGGSTIILIVKKENVKIDDDLFENTKNGYETCINMGEKIGLKK